MWLVKRIWLVFLMLCGVACNAQTVIKVKRPGMLEQMVEAHRLDTCTFLAVKGKLNSSDIKVLRRMGGYARAGEVGGRLFSLDLRKAKFKNDNMPYMELEVSKEKLAGVICPELSFWYTPAASGSSVIPKSISRNSDLNSFDRGQGKVSGYKAVYYLGHTSKTPLGVKMLAEDSNCSWYEELWNKTEFSAEAGVSDSLWNDLHKKKLDKFSGHRIEKRADGYYLLAMSRKGQFSPATFYDCPNLRIVALPKNINFTPDIYDEGNCICYFLGKLLYLWNRQEIAEEVQDKLRRQMKSGRKEL